MQATIENIFLLLSDMDKIRYIDKKICFLEKGKSHFLGGTKGKCQYSNFLTSWARIRCNLRFILHFKFSLGFMLEILQFWKTECNLLHFTRNCRIKNLKEMRQTHICGEQDF